MTRLVIIVTFLLTSHFVMGQIRIGPKTGLKLNNLSNGSEFQVLKSGFEFGAMGNVPLSKELYLQTEILITNKGYKEKYGDEIFDQLTTTYLQLPVLIQYRMGTNKLEYYGIAGVYAARWTGGKFRSRIEEEATIVEEDYTFVTSYNTEGFRDRRQEFGAILGAGLIYPLSVNHLIFDVRYNYGFTDVNDLQNEPAGYEKRSNRGIAITLGILFYL